MTAIVSRPVVTLTAAVAGEPGFVMPTRDEVLGLVVGSMVPSAFGKLSPIESIFGSGEDREGRAYVCYRTSMGEGSTITGSVKEGELHRNIATSGQCTSAELDALERTEREARECDADLLEERAAGC